MRRFALLASGLLLGSFNLPAVADHSDWRQREQVEQRGYYDQGKDWKDQYKFQKKAYKHELKYERKAHDFNAIKVNGHTIFDRRRRLADLQSKLAYTRDPYRRFEIQQKI